MPQRIPFALTSRFIRGSSRLRPRDQQLVVEEARGLETTRDDYQALTNKGR